MILGENPNRSNSTVHVPPWTFLDDPSPLSGVSVNFDGNANATDYSPFYLQEALTALQLYLPSVTEAEIDSDYESESTVVTDVFSSDQFRMFDFKVKKCTRGRSHDWTECPYAHPGEKARRRDPRRYHYSGTACAEFRKGSCKRGDSCEFAHGVFECWLHPSRYRTQPCKDGTSCRRRVCFFAHTAEQLRVLPPQILSPSSTRSVNSIPSYDGSPLRQAIEACAKQITFSPLSPPSLSPPVTPKAELLSSSPPQSPMIHSMVANLRNLELNKELGLGLGQGKVQSPSSLPWNVQVGSPLSVTRPGYCSLPTTPTRPGIRFLDFWDLSCGEEPAMERVESGRDLRAKMFEKLRKENSVGVPDEDSSIGGGGLDVGWVSELIK